PPDTSSLPISAGATSAMALDIADVPANPADWATSPYSPLEPSAIAAPDNAVQLDFTGAEGGLNAAGDVGTGFTMVQPSSADATYYLPQNLSVADSKLNILTTPGLAHAKPGIGVSGDVNKQDNTLGVGLDTDEGESVRLTTTLQSPNGAWNSAQGGLWFGPNDDNYVKLAVIGNSTTAGNTSARQVQLSRETGGAVPNETTDQRSETKTQTALSGG